MNKISVFVAAMLLILFSGSSQSRPSMLDCEEHLTDEMVCMACNIYHEARNEPPLGQYAVGLVTVNRVLSDRFPNTICGVVWQAPYSRQRGRRVAQFSWTLDGRPDDIYDSEAWNYCMFLASFVIDIYQRDNYHTYDIVDGALFYHADYVSPSWRHNLQFVAKIGRHLFYKT